jgi:hypothetical protein
VKSWAHPDPSQAGVAVVDAVGVDGFHYRAAALVEQMDLAKVSRSQMLWSRWFSMGSGSTILSALIFAVRWLSCTRSRSRAPDASRTMSGMPTFLTWSMSPVINL